MQMVMDSFPSSTVALVVPSSSGPPQEDNGGETSKRRKRYLGQDLITEIFARLPGKTLMRFKCISKFWYSLIRSPNFITMHSTHSHRNTKIVSFLRGHCSSATSTPTTTLSFRFGDHLEEEDLTLPGRLEITNFEIVGCLNGVVCLSLSKPPQMYVLWNPATKQVRQIWAPRRDGPIIHVWYGSVLSFDPATNGFKVAQFKFIPLDEGETRAQVNVFSTATNTWKSKNMVVPYRILRTSLHPGHTTCVNGFIYWLVGITTFKNHYILSYNMSDEVFQRIQMPSCPAYFVLHSLTTYKGSLAMFVIDQGPIHSTEVDVWALNDCDGNQPWSKILTCKLSCDVTRVVGLLKKDGHDLILIYNGGVRFLYLYDPENGETKVLLAREKNLDTILYTESLVSLYNQVKN